MLILKNTPFKIELFRDGYKMSKMTSAQFSLQWHITAKCENDCAHCYMKEEESYENEISNELSYDACTNILSDFATTLKRWEMPARVVFTGGDPLLNPNLYKLISFAKELGFEVSILGNPDLLTTDIARKLKNLGVIRYQISIDGLEETHDRLRGRKGAFKNAIRAIRILNEVELPSVVMFTLSKENINDLIPVINLVANENVFLFDFARLVPIGNGREIGKNLISSNEYHDLLIKIYQEYLNLQEQGVRTIYGHKDHLWLLLFQELGLVRPLPSDEIIYNGCAIGLSILTILADGTVYSCRRLPITLGKVPEDKLTDIFIKSKELNELRDISRFIKCSRCDLLRFCRGCPAVSYAVNGDYFSEDPQCWKEIVKND